MLYNSPKYCSKRVTELLSLLHGHQLNDLSNLFGYKRTFEQKAFVLGILSLFLIPFLLPETLVDSLLMVFTNTDT